MGSIKGTKVELGKLQDIQALLEKAKNQVKEDMNLQKTLKTNYSRSLIILDQNIPAQCDAAIKIATELDATETVVKFEKVKKEALDLKNQIEPIYKQL